MLPFTEHLALLFKPQVLSLITLIGCSTLCLGQKNRWGHHIPSKQQKSAGLADACFISL